MKSRVMLLPALFCLVVLFLANGQISLAEAGQSQMEMIWTKWDADHYALAEDGEAIWLGTASGLIRWDKESRTYTRVSTADGLPQRDVWAIAVDGQGNRWFGGDGGLSRLDASGEWTHYNAANSGMHSSRVTGIAAAADGTVWLSHNPDSQVSQLTPDGKWVVFASRKAAVIASYAAIKGTVNQNELWTVSGDDVWLGYEVYDGSSWQTISPPGSGGWPQVTAAASNGTIWFMEDYAVYGWDGQAWAEYPFSYYFDGYLNALAVDEQDGVWVGWQERNGNPYTNHSAGISRLPETPGFIDLEQFLSAPPPVSALWPAENGVWGTGPNWLLEPDNMITRFSDEPFFENVMAAVVDRRGRTWLHSSYYWPYTAGVMQTLDDEGTATMADDEGEVWQSPRPSIVRALEPAPNGDLWMAWEDDWRFRFPGGPARFMGEDVVEYQPPSYTAYIGDIFIEQDGQVWFTYTIPEGEKGVWSFDDGGTPRQTGDDSWQSYPIQTTGGKALVAVQDGRIWYGDASGLYRRIDGAWDKASGTAVTDLVPAAGGALFVGQGETVLTIERDGRQRQQPLKKLIAEDLARVRSTARRNHMWTVAPDGGVWYWQGTRQLARRDKAGVQVFETPVTSDTIEVDENNHVWLADGALWRLSRRPDFALQIHPHLWLMTAEDEQRGRIQVTAIEGYGEPVTLSVNGLPDGVAATIEPKPVVPGAQATLHLTASGAVLGDYDLLLKGDSASMGHEWSFKLTVAETVHDMILPVIAR